MDHSGYRRVRYRDLAKKESLIMPASIACIFIGNSFENLNRVGLAQDNFTVENEFE